MFYHKSITDTMPDVMYEGERSGHNKFTCPLSYPTCTFRWSLAPFVSHRPTSRSQRGANRMSQRLSPLSLSCNPLRTQRRWSILPPFASATPIAHYHDYVRFQTSGKLKVALNSTNLCLLAGGVGRIPLLNPKVIGLLNSRGNRAYASALGSSNSTWSRF